MTSMNVSLSDQMKQWVENQIQTGKFHTASEYVRELIRKDQSEAEKLDTLRAAIQTGIDSGESSLNFDEVIAAIRASRQK